MTCLDTVQNCSVDGLCVNFPIAISPLFPWAASSPVEKFPILRLWCDLPNYPVMPPDHFQAVVKRSVNNLWKSEFAIGLKETTKSSGSVPPYFKPLHHIISFRSPLSFIWTLVGLQTFTVMQLTVPKPHSLFYFFAKPHLTNPHLPNHLRLFIFAFSTHSLIWCVQSAFSGAEIAVVLDCTVTSDKAPDHWPGSLRTIVILIYNCIKNIWKKQPWWCQPCSSTDKNAVALT